MDFDIQAIDDFNHCIDDIDVSEFPTRGYYYTWCNHREEGTIYSKFGKLFVNDAWYSDVNGAEAEFAT